MLQAAADILIATRQRMASTLKELTQEQWFAQPDGFANNIAWNVGHLIMAQQGLCYGRMHIQPHIELAGMRAMYGGGTSPADWSENPETDELLRLFVELPQKMTADIAAGKFDSYVKPEPVEGRFPPPESVMHGFIFNQHHEGMHAGAIGDLIGYMASQS